MTDLEEKLSLVLNFKVLGKIFGPFWLNRCPESRVRGRVVVTHTNVCGQGQFQKEKGWVDSLHST